MKLKTFRIGGVHPAENKLSNDAVTQPAPLPKQAVFPLSQHIGAPAKAIVKEGDKVKVGTMIGEAGGFVSANIFSSVSGTVAKVGDVMDVSGAPKPCVVINVEGDEWEETIDRSDKLETLEAHPELTAEEIVNRVKYAGVVGMGGACFPTHVKLMPPPNAKAECVIINGVECEPYITSDYRLMMEKPDQLIEGLKLLMAAVHVSQGYIGIEDNKPAAIELIDAKLKEKGITNIEVIALKKKYPQGGEKQLIDAVIGRQVPAPPAIPINVGAVVQNAGTAVAVYEAVMKRKPLFERYTTVTGKEIAKPSNFLVRMGTSFEELINLCGGMPDGDNKVLAGGPMMGRAVPSIQVPVGKGQNAITILSGDDAKRKEPQPCIRCAKCVSACPMGLEPFLLAKGSVAKKWDMLEEEMITSCIECGSCQFTCPAYRPLLDDIRVGKQTVMGIIRSRTAPAPAPAAKPAAKAEGGAKGTAKPMSTAEKPFVVPEVDFSGPKKNPVPTISCGPKPAIMPKGWPK
jgi:electron transport complex protein RnfC